MPPRQGQSSYNEIMTWYSSIPPITKALFMLCIGTTTVSTFGIIRPLSLILYWPDIRNKLQLWRLVSCFFVNRFSLGFAFNTYFLYRNSLQLETDIFNRPLADYIFFLLMTGGIQLAASSVLDLYVLNDGLLLASLQMLYRQKLLLQVQLILQAKYLILSPLLYVLLLLLVFWLHFYRLYVQWQYIQITDTPYLINHLYKLPLFCTLIDYLLYLYSLFIQLSLRSKIGTRERLSHLLTASTW